MRAGTFLWFLPNRREPTGKPGRRRKVLLWVQGHHVCHWSKVSFHINEGKLNVLAFDLLIREKWESTPASISKLCPEKWPHPAWSCTTRATRPSSTAGRSSEGHLAFPTFSHTGRTRASTSTSPQVGAGTPRGLLAGGPSAPLALHCCVSLPQL